MRGFKETGSDKECCGTCRWHCEEVIPFDGKKGVDWYCNNHMSDFYLEYTEYEDDCDNWED